MKYCQKIMPDNFVNRYVTEDDKRLCRRFVNIYLRPDGVFMIRLLSKNTNSIIVSELVAALWDNYKKKHQGHRNPVPNTVTANIKNSGSCDSNLHPHANTYTYHTTGSLHSRNSYHPVYESNKCSQPSKPKISGSTSTQPLLAVTNGSPRNYTPNVCCAEPNYTLAAGSGYISGIQARKQIEAMSNSITNDIIDV